MRCGRGEGERGKGVIGEEEGMMKVVESKEEGGWWRVRGGMMVVGGGVVRYGVEERVQEDEVVRDGVEGCGEMCHSIHGVL